MAVLEREQIKTYRSAAYPSRTFSMDQTPEAFMALSGLYSNRIRAVVREIGTNGLDSHIEKKTPDVPVWVHLPNIDDASFWQRDFGVSLPIRLVTGDIEFDPDTGDPIDNTETHIVGSYAEVEEFIGLLIEDAETAEYVRDGIIIDGVHYKIIDEAMVLYTTYFRSTKRGTNEQTGQLGLGSKSPFTITDSFQVRVYYHKEMRQYSLNINDDGIPEVNLIDDLTGPTEEPDGVEVRLDVKYSEFFEFERSAKIIYRDFATRPRIIDNDGETSEDFQIEEYDVFLRGDNWLMAHNLDQPYLRMGNVRYPIDRYTDGITEQNRSVLELKLLIDCPIGVVDIVPSREGLKYTKRTIAYLNACLDKIREHAEQRIRDTLDESATLWEARCWSNDMLFERNSELAGLARMCKIENLTYQGEKLGKPEIPIREIKDVSILRFNREPNYVRGSYYSQTGWKAVRNEDPSTIRVSHHTVLVIDDLPRGAQSRVRHMIKQQPDHESDCDVKYVYVCKFATKQAKDDLLAALGYPPEKMLKASDMERAPQSQRASSSFRWSTNEQVFVHTGKCSARRLMDYWEAKKKDLNDGGIYVELCRYKAKKTGCNYPAEPRSIGIILKGLKAVGLPVPEVVGVRPAVAKHFRKSDKWIDFWSYVKTTVTNEVIEQDVATKIANHRVVQEQSPDNCDTWDSFATFQPKYQDSVMGRFTQIWKENWLYEKFDKREEWSNLCHQLGVKLEVKAVEVPDFGDEINKVLKRYPMIDVLLDEIYGTWEDKSHERIVEYIHMIDKSHNPNEVEDEVPF